METLDPQVIPQYENLKNQVNDHRWIVGFVTKNGKRIICRSEYASTCVSIDKKFTLIDTEVYESPFALIQGYFTDGSIPITEVVLFYDYEEAHTWLLN
jgi:hypothetical protein